MGRPGGGPRGPSGGAPRGPGGYMGGGPMGSSGKGPSKGMGGPRGPRLQLHMMWYTVMRQKEQLSRAGLFRPGMVLLPAGPRIQARWPAPAHCTAALPGAQAYDGAGKQRTCRCNAAVPGKVHTCCPCNSDNNTREST
eukprot:1147499-Pelagomonas_calceolata.AAC.4